LATNNRARRVEPAYKQHNAVDAGTDQARFQPGAAKPPFCFRPTPAVQQGAL
jgi:hypothetical protein